MKIQQNPSLDYLKNCLSELLRFSRGKQKESMLVDGLDKPWAKL